MFGIRFPYHEKSLEGVFGYGIRKLNVNIRYDASLSSLYNDNYPASNCFDGDQSTMCHTNGSESQYIQVHFLDLSFKIEGFAVQNRADGAHNPLNYAIRGSNDGYTFDDIKLFEENNSEVCDGGIIRTHRVKSNTKYSYIRLQMTGLPCVGVEYWLNLAEFDLFGSFGEMSMCFQSIKRNKTFLSRSMCFIFMVIYS